jgi:hypothetical protein
MNNIFGFLHRTEPERLLQFLCKEGNETFSAVYDEGNT